MELHLREVTDDDVELFYMHQIDEGAARMAAFASRDHDAHVAHWMKIRADRTVVLRSVVLEGRVVGNVVSFTKDGKREIGYWIDREHWGKGVATEAVARFLEVETERPLNAWVADHNVGSIRVLEKCGFRRTAHQPAEAPDEPGFVALELP